MSAPDYIVLGLIGMAVLLVGIPAFAAAISLARDWLREPPESRNRCVQSDIVPMQCPRCSTETPHWHVGPGVDLKDNMFVVRGSPAGPV